ncbi:MAG: Kae1-associated kinase Bud32 [Candidatus Korarchaeota archaeon]
MYEKKVLIYRGAEAELWLSEWYGLKTVVKRRLPKSFIIPELDALLRKTRTRREVRMLARARQLGLPVPAVYYVDLASSEIYLEYIEGVRLSELINKGEKCESIINKFGHYIGILHSAGILHGDLTTANVIVRENIPVIIDFGLSDKGRDSEDFGTEIHLFKRAIKTAHPLYAEEIFSEFIDGYKKGNPQNWNEILLRATEIAKRGRYIPPEER